MFGFNFVLPFCNYFWISNRTLLQTLYLQHCFEIRILYRNTAADICFAFILCSRWNILKDNDSRLMTLWITHICNWASVNMLQYLILKFLDMKRFKIVPYDLVIYTVEPHLFRPHLSRLFSYLDTCLGTNWNIHI